MAGGFDKIKAWGAQWKLQAEGSDFLGEVALPPNDLELRLDLLHAKFRPDLADPDVLTELFSEPLSWDGEVERLDAASEPSTSTPGGGVEP